MSTTLTAAGLKANPKTQPGYARVSWLVYGIDKVSKEYTLFLRHDGR